MTIGPVRQDTLRAKVFAHIDPRARNIEGLSFFNKIIIVVVVVASVGAILHTEPGLVDDYEREFFWFEVCAGAIFLLEYGLRLWTAPEATPNFSPTVARLRFVFSPLGLLDLVIIASIFTPLLFENSAFLRMLRVMRILALARLTRFSIALRYLVGSINERRYDLLITLCMAGFLMLFGASALYWIEGKEQPEAFGSIPRALWWSVITLTTVGYGDVSPVTAQGKIVASFVALSGVALVALPTGILAAAFSDSMQRRREEIKALKEADEIARRSTPIE
ncbi:ion transporter [Erythrobacter sp. HKB08]|uniref:ion transporter n=1 Tax=Erythrobacter sp. HKB08 TaxID=2502843 RepID=UPI0013E8A94B|nr:ion transporter [Erythrobacter sp. HKB08]